eukprot:scaffold52775_cov17-Prasinocladus_malaysianus.AAC.1
MIAATSAVVHAYESPDRPVWDFYQDVDVIIGGLATPTYRMPSRPIVMVELCSGLCTGRRSLLVACRRPCTLPESHSTVTFFNFTYQYDYGYDIHRTAHGFGDMFVVRLRLLHQP